MTDPLDRFRRLSATPAAAVRLACVLEATAPKVGNVYPTKSFADLTYADFVAAAEIAAGGLTDERKKLSQRILETAIATRREIGTNVNLGILLLLGPLVAADQAGGGNDWHSAIAGVLSDLDGTDGANIFAAISAAKPGGIGESETHDVRTTSGPVDIVAAMTAAAQRDRIARQYATGFSDLLTNIVPVIDQQIQSAGDELTGICRGHLQLLAEQSDSLIARKRGVEVAEQVRQRAKLVNINDSVEIERFDNWLRKDGNQLNPGTTADLIAAALYVLLRSRR